MKIVGGNGVLLVAGEAFAWRPWEAGTGKGKDGEGREGGPLWSKRLVNERGQWEVEDEAWGLLGLVWPKPGGFWASFLRLWCLVNSVKV